MSATHFVDFHCLYSKCKYQYISWKARIDNKNNFQKNNDDFILIPTLLETKIYQEDLDVHSKTQYSTVKHLFN